MVKYNRVQTFDSDFIIQMDVKNKFFLTRYTDKNIITK